jgi:plasmid stabilization system protein ParE
LALGFQVAPSASAQIRAAFVWWEEHRPGAPDLLRKELQRAFELITSQPGVGTPALDKGFEGVRRISLRRSRYQLYYQLREETLEVLALWHASRGQGPPLASPM